MPETQVQQTYTPDMLRPYQVQALARLTDERDRLGAQGSTVLALPTGSGKTLTAVAWIKQEYLDKGKRVLWWVHRIELFRQAQECFAFVSPETEVTTWTTDTKDSSGQVVLAMILSSRNLMGTFDLVVEDEAHHRSMPTYTRKENEIEWDFLLGLTATPTRLDGSDLRFDSVAAQQSLLDLVVEGFLAKPVYVQVQTKQRHKMRITAGDFSGKSLKQLDNNVRNHMVADIWADSYRQWGKTLVFCCGIEHAENIETLLRSKAEDLELDPDMVVCVHSKITDSQRAERIQRFLSGEARVLLNVGIFTEGFDCPDIKTVMMARPTASETLYCQMVGRGARITEDKNAFYVVDFVDELGNYSLLARQWAIDLLGAEDLIEEDEEKEQERIEGIMRATGAPKGVREEVVANIVSFAGLLRYQTQYSKGPRVLACTTDLHEAWVKLQILQDRKGRRMKEVIASSYALSGADSAGLSLGQWRDLAWATFFQREQRDTRWTALSRGVIEFVPFRETELDRQTLRDEIDVAAERNSALNTEFGAPERREWLITEINDVVQRQCFIQDFARTAFYQDQVVKITPGYQRESITGGVRGEIREAIREHLSDTLDIDVQLLVYWPDRQDVKKPAPTEYSGYRRSFPPPPSPPRR
jgi:superfamily II DNA or RNA helicase